MSKSISMSAALAGYFHVSLNELPSEKRKLVERNFTQVRLDLSPAWDDLTPTRRRKIVVMWDQAHPTTDLARKQEADAAFRAGHKHIARARANRRNAKKRRPSAQKVSDDDILRTQRELEAEGVKRRNQRSEAHRRISALRNVSISKNGFLKRWNLLGLGKKET